MQIIARSAWQARQPKRPPFVAPPQTRHGLTVHHNGPPMGLDVSRPWPEVVAREHQLLRGVQNWHMDRMGWDDFAYSHAVGQTGRCYEGRGLFWRQFANGADQVAADDGPDARWYTVLWLGGGTEHPTPAAYATLAALVRHLRDAGAGTRVIPHNDIRRKPCPGPELTAWCRTVDGQPTTPPPATEESDHMDIVAYVNQCYHEAGRLPGEDMAGRRYWIREIAGRTGQARVDVMRLMETLLGLS